MVPVEAVNPFRLRTFSRRNGHLYATARREIVFHGSPHPPYDTWWGMDTWQLHKGLNVNLGAGTKDRYSNRAFGGTQSKDLKAFGMMSANNVNDMGFPGGGGGRFGGGRQGLTATKMVGFNLNYEIPDKLILDQHFSSRYN